MKIKRRIAAMLAALALAGTAIGVVGTADAMAINRVDDCTNRTDLFTTYSTTGNTCWANNGGVDVKLYMISMVSPGYNSGSVEIDDNQIVLFRTWESFGFSGYPTITHIQITGR